MTSPSEVLPDEAGGPPPSADEPGPAKPTNRSGVKTAVEWVAIIATALFAAFLIKTFLVQAFYIPSVSMEPTLKVNDRILVNKLSYRLHGVERGDVVVFERPPNELGTVRDLVKRVIALPDETVEGRDGHILINGRAIPEAYLPEGSVTSTFGPEKVPPNHFWVMGDNRGNSSDSRVFKSIDESRIIGKAFVRIWPVGDFGLL